jgi:type VI secretion system secreted protein VgrG
VIDAIKASEKLYKNSPVSLYNHSLLQNGTNDLRDAVKLQKDKRANVFFVEGKSHKPDLKLGSFVKITGLNHGERAFSGGKVPLETYRIVALNMHHDGIDGYHNTFVAVPYQIVVPHYMNDDAVPICESQSAVVVDNNDPNGMSRIRVQFPWQKQMGEITPWLRVVTPYAGGGKGQHILPEIGEEVLVGFENDNAEKPFVHGAMYHGEGKSGHGGEGNFIKSFQTATGIKLVMNDKEKSFLLEDPSGNTVFADGKGNMTLTAPNNITMNAGGSINMTAGQNINSSATLNITESAGVDKSTTAGMMHNLFVGGNSILKVMGSFFERIEGSKNSHTEKERNVTAEKKIQTNTSGTTQHHSDKEVQHNSAEKTKMF